MPIFALLAFSAICFSEAQPSPVGSYKPDLTRAPRRSFRVLKAVFGSTVLRVSPEGRFSFCGIRQSGFWRMHRGRLVLVHQGFMGTPVAIPDEVLKRTWQDGGAFGLVMSFRKSNLLRMARFGRVPGSTAGQTVPPGSPSFIA